MSLVHSLNGRRFHWSNTWKRRRTQVTAMMTTTPISRLPDGLTVRHDLIPGDLAYIVCLHGMLYAAEYGFDSSFENYVAEPLSAFSRLQTSRDRIWIVERGHQIVGCLAIVCVSDQEAQLRWFLVDPSARGMGLGRHLIVEAISFCKSHGYDSVFLWTVRALTAAAHLYESVGFRKTEEQPGQQWGVDVIEEKYILKLGDGRTADIHEFLSDDCKNRVPPLDVG